MTRNEILPYDPKLKQIARMLRKNMTYAEVLLWQEIRKQKLGYQFHRQVPIKKYVVDFYCHELRLAIEVDGSTHRHPEVSTKDAEKQQEIEKLDVEFLRFENSEVKSNMGEVLKIIQRWIKLNHN